MKYSFLHLSPSKPDNIKNLAFQSSLSPSKVYEDNNACIILATTDTNFKPHTKHISLKYHHFHDPIANGNLQILKVDTNQNWADTFTKPLGRHKFEHIQKLLKGW
jgi:hypothetical protein